MRSALFWNITQRVVLISYWRFRTTYRSHLQGPIGCPETSVRNYGSALPNIPEQRRSQGNLMFCIAEFTRLEDVLAKTLRGGVVGFLNFWWRNIACYRFSKIPKIFNINIFILSCIKKITKNDLVDHTLGTIGLSRQQWNSLWREADSSTTSN